MSKPLIARLLAVAAVALVVVPAAHAGAGGLRWSGAARTEVSFASFAGEPYTIMARFMPQHMRGYRGPIFGTTVSCPLCRPGPSFEVGIATYGEGELSARGLVLEVEGVKRLYATPLLAARTWHHIAVRRTDGWFGSEWRLYLDGQHLCAVPPASCNISGVGFGEPSGNVVLGRSYNATTGDDPSTTHQFYGFIDDVAIFNEALTESLIAAHAEAANPISGGEADLLAGWNFEPGTQPAVLSSPLTYSGNAFLSPFVGGSTHFKNGLDANKYDAPMLPYAADTYAMKLPFKSLQQWKVTQGWEGTDSHYGTSVFSLDMVREDSATIGSAVYAPPTGGIVRLADDTWADDDPNLSCPKGDSWSNCNKLQIEIKPGVVVTYRHLKKGSVAEAFGRPPQPGWTVDPGQKIAEVGDHPNGAHLHFGMRNSYADSGTPSVSIPTVFQGFQIYKNDIWSSIGSGVPAQGDVVRNP